MEIIDAHTHIYPEKIAERAKDFCVNLLNAR